MEIWLVILCVVVLVLWCVHDKGKTRAGYLGYYWDIHISEGRKERKKITFQTVDARTCSVMLTENIRKMSRGVEQKKYFGDRNNAQR